MKCTQDAKQGNKIRAKTCKPYGGCIASLGAEDFRSTDSKYYKNRYAPATSHFFWRWRDCIHLFYQSQGEKNIQCDNQYVKENKRGQITWIEFLLPELSA